MATKLSTRFVKGFLILPGLGLLYLLFWPVSIDPQPWTPPQAPDLSQGIYAANEDLSSLSLFSTKPYERAPEDIAIDTNGFIYGGVIDGKIIRFQPDGSNPEIFAETGGRPLGLHFDQNQNLIVADSKKGILSIDPSGEVNVLASGHEGVEFVFADDLDIDSSGVIYFSDASTEFGFHDFKDILYNHKPDGRLLSFNPENQETKILAEGFFFANGIAVSPDQNFVLVVETASYRIKRYWLKGPKAGTTDIFIENLPGFPDGVSSNGKGIFWVAIGNPRNQALDKLLPYPFLRKIVKRLPAFVQPKEVRYSMVLGLDAEGNVIHNLHDPTGKLAMISSVQEANGHLYLGTISDPAFGRIVVPD